MKKEDLGFLLGKAVREARKALGLTQATMAERLDVSVEFYGRLERGAARPSIELFAHMVAILGVSADTLLGLDAARAVEPARLTRPDDPPELRELVPLLCEARPSVVRLVGIDPPRVRSRARRSQTRWRLQTHHSQSQPQTRPRYQEAAGGVEVTRNADAAAWQSSAPGISG
jgi:transcriptional regulator with XRE-family HTH domain